MNYPTKAKVLKAPVVWKDLFIYRKSDAIYQLTVEFCHRFQGLRSDYHDYLNTRHLPLWPADSDRQQRLRDFCHSHNDYDDYAPLVSKMNDEEMANLLLTLCHQTDKMMCSYIEKLEQRFVTEGGIKERMHAARTGYRQEADARLRALETENQQLKKRIKELESLLGNPRKS